MSLSVTTKERSEGIFTVYPEGALDSSTHTILEKEIEKIQKMSPKTIIFDMQDLKYISSIGLRLIVKAKKMAKNYGGTILLVNLQPQIKEIFRIVKALPSEPIFESVQELDDYLISMQNKIIDEE
jgi:anti-sigma B factor antagonist